MTSFLYYYCENKVKSHLSTLCWGEGRNLRDGYLQISADKSQSCTLDSTFIIQGNRPIKPQNWNVSSIHLPLWKYTFGHGSHLHHSSRVNSFGSTLNESPAVVTSSVNMLLSLCYIFQSRVDHFFTEMWKQTQCVRCYWCFLGSQTNWTVVFATAVATRPPLGNVEGKVCTLPAEMWRCSEIAKLDAKTADHRDC